MSSLTGSTKVSDVLEILSVQTISDDNYWNIPASASTNSWNYEREKQIFTDAVHYCMVLLRQSNRLTNHKSDILSLEATLTGHVMFEKIMNVKVQTELEPDDRPFVPTSNVLNHTNTGIPHFPNNSHIEIKEEPMDATNHLDETLLIASMETIRGGEQRSVEKTVRDVVCESDKIDSEKSSECPRVLRSKSPAQRVTVNNNSIDKNNFPPSPLSLTESDESQTSVSSKKRPGSVFGKSRTYISLETKKKVVALAQKHPEWSLKMLQEHGSKQLGCFSQLWQWEQQIAVGGTLRDKFDTINHWTYQKFIEVYSSSKPVTIDMLRGWAIQAAREFYGAKFQFTATRSWLYNFRRAYDIQITADGHLTTSNNRMGSKSRKPVRSNRRKSTAI